MYVEAFTAAKDPRHPERNEDRFSARSGRYFAVIDGVTDKSGVPLPGGSSRGQEAGLLIDRTLAALDDEDRLFSAPAAQLLERLAAAFRERYRDLGELPAAEADPNMRFGAQLALAVLGSRHDAQAVRLLIVGDCGARIDATRTVGTSQPAESVLARWRGLVVEDALERGVSVEDALACGRHYCLEGTARFATAWAHVLPRGAWEVLRERAQAELAAHVAGMPSGTLSTILEGGVKGAARFRNAPGPLGQACLDGFAVPLDKVVDELVPLGDAPANSVVELFSDGYFGTPPEGASGVAAWEEHLAGVEREDPYKIGRHPATKGSLPGAFTDDRTVLVMRTAGAAQ